MGEVLTTAALLACPVGMGAMMWFMARGGRKKQSEPEAMSVADLRTEHERLGAELSRAESRGQVRS